MTIRIRNDSTSAVVRGYALDSHHTVIWLEMAPQHPKTIGAIWADLVQAQRPWLQLGDFDVAGSGRAVRGLGSRYERLTADAPELALGHNARPRLLWLVAPCCLKASEKEPFYIFSWPGIDAAAALAAMLERDTRWPVQICWGKHLLDIGLAEGFEMAADFPTDVLVNMLNTIEDGLEYLDWYGNIQNSIHLADRTPLASNPATSEDGHLESDYEDRVSGTDG